MPTRNHLVYAGVFSHSKLIIAIVNRPLDFKFSLSLHFLMFNKYKLYIIALHIFLCIFNTHIHNCTQRLYRKEKKY